MDQWDTLCSNKSNKTGDIVQAISNTVTFDMIGSSGTCSKSLEAAHDSVQTTLTNKLQLLKIFWQRLEYPIGSMYAIYGNIYHQYTPNVSIYTIHGSYGVLEKHEKPGWFMVANFVSQGSTTPLTMQGNGWPCSFPGIPRDLKGIAPCFTESSEWRRGPCEAGSSSVTEATRCGPRMMRMMSTQCWMDSVYNLYGWSIQEAHQWGKVGNIMQNLCQD